MRRTTILLALIPTLAFGSEPRPVTADELAAVRHAVADRLKDPDSAQIRNVMVSPDGENLTVCGEVNAKNAYGGYVGFRKFLGMLILRANKGPMAIIVGIDSGNAAAVEQTCAKYGI
jgi:hypothetical protein